MLTGATAGMPPSSRKEVWRPEEDAIIQQAVSQMGSKWSQIAHCLPFRTEAAIRNRYLRLEKQKAAAAGEQEALEASLASIRAEDLANPAAWAAGVLALGAAHNQPTGVSDRCPWSPPADPSSAPLFGSFSELLGTCMARWLRKEEVLDVLLRPDAYGLSLTDEVSSRELRPSRGTLLLVNKQLHRSFRNDSLAWRTRELARGGRGLAETHERLKVRDGTPMAWLRGRGCDGSIQ